MTCLNVPVGAEPFFSSSKFEFCGHLIALACWFQNCFFFWIVYSPIIRLQSLRSHVHSSVKKIFFSNIQSCDVSKDAYWITQLNYRIIFKNLESWQEVKKDVKIGKYKSIVFRLQNEQFKFFLKIDSIFESSIPVHDDIWKNYFLNFITEDPKLSSRIIWFKKKKNSFKIS